jgi:small GTP-binding protein
MANGECNVKHAPTVGASFQNLNVLNKNQNQITLSIWDTAGEERYKSLIPTYFANSQIALLVFDITNQETFNKLFRYHKLLLSRANENIIIYFVGNKSDLEEQREIDIQDVEIYKEQINAYAYAETFALSGIGVDELFTLIVDHPDLEMSKTIINELVKKENGPTDCC